jgi:hypothetical protein
MDPADRPELSVRAIPSGTGVETGDTQPRRAGIGKVVDIRPNFAIYHMPWGAVAYAGTFVWAMNQMTQRASLRRLATSIQKDRSFESSQRHAQIQARCRRLRRARSLSATISRVPRPEN